jgi:hypothetical protein
MKKFLFILANCVLVSLMVRAQNYDTAVTLVINKNYTPPIHAPNIIVSAKTNMALGR